MPTYLQTENKKPAQKNQSELDQKINHFHITSSSSSHNYISKRIVSTVTECPKIYRISVLHLLKYTANVYLIMQFRFAVQFGTLSMLAPSLQSPCSRPYDITLLILYIL